MHMTTHSLSQYIDDGKVAVVTDSVAQVPATVAGELGISVVPFSVLVEDATFRDEVDITPTELYQRMRTEGILPRTSHPSLGEYLQVFRERLQAGAGSILYLPVSGKLSGAYDTALEAAPMIREEYPDREIGVFDTRTATIAQGFIAIEAAQASCRGAALGQVMDIAKDVRTRTGFVATLDTLEYLARGGRIGKLAYMLGSMIDVKPILNIGDDGLVAPIARVRGAGRSLEKMVAWVAERVAGKPGLRLAVMEGDAPDQAARLRDLALQELQPDEIFITSMTPVIGVHAGPGIIGLAYYHE